LLRFHIITEKLEYVAKTVDPGLVEHDQMTRPLQVDSSVTGIGDDNKVGQTRFNNDTCVVLRRYNAESRRRKLTRPAIVCFLSDASVVDQLKASPDEVDYVFTHPLAAVLSGRPGDGYMERLQPIGGEWWPHDEEFHVCSELQSHYKSKVDGLTSSLYRIG
jgi:hypothetical protein